MPSDMTRPPVTGALWIIASALAFMAANIAIRHLGAKLPPLEMAMFRSAGGLIMVLVAWRAFLHLRQLRDPHIHLVRAVVGAVSLMALVHSYATLPVALVTAFMYVRAALVVPMARLFLGERVGPDVWAAVGLGIAGGIVALWPRLSTVGTPEFGWSALILPLAALAGAGSHICMRRLALTNPPSVVVAVSAILVTAFVAVPASSVAIEPPAADVPLLVSMALLSGLAQWFTVRGYRYASPARLAPLSLIDVPIALVAGYVLFGEVPGSMQAVGSAMILGAALYVVRAERSDSR
ncbi:EamA family transporter [Azospirillum brasilense]|nr:EamA family transporter [Azospirillum brasilense]